MEGYPEPAPARVCTVPAAGGLWTTAADLMRFALSWASLPIEPVNARLVRPVA